MDLPDAVPGSRKMCRTCNYLDKLSSDLIEVWEFESSSEDV